MNRMPMTPEGHAALQAELKRHLEVLRPKIVKDIEEARAHGDLSENSEYDDAKHRQGICEAKIADFRGQLALADVVDIKDVQPSDRVVFGTTVVLEDLDTEETITYRIVGLSQADVLNGMISYSSPIGRALIGKCIDDEVTVVTPGGRRLLAITDVKYQ